MSLDFGKFRALFVLVACSFVFAAYSFVFVVCSFVFVALYLFLTHFFVLLAHLCLLMAALNHCKLLLPRPIFLFIDTQGWQQCRYVHMFSYYIVLCLYFHAESGTRDCYRFSLLN